MKPISLNKKQEEYILKMCKTLFPEYDRIHWQLDRDEGYENTGNIYLGKWPFNKFKTATEFHWFEFTLNHLIPKLITYNALKGIYSMGIDELQSVFLSENGIDSVYHFFKHGYIK